jgi:hypothetical protein
VLASPPVLRCLKLQRNYTPQAIDYAQRIWQPSSVLVRDGRLAHHRLHYEAGCDPLQTGAVPRSD